MKAAAVLESVRKRGSESNRPGRQVPQEEREAKERARIHDEAGKGLWIPVDEDDAVELRIALDKADEEAELVVKAYRYLISHGETSEFVNRFVHSGGASK